MPFSPFEIEESRTHTRTNHVAKLVQGPSRGEMKPGLRVQVDGAGDDGKDDDVKVAAGKGATLSAFIAYGT